MTQLTTLTPAAVHAVLHGLAEPSCSSDGTARAEAITAMADALTQPRPVDPELTLLRSRLAETLGYDPADEQPTDDDLIAEVRATLAGYAGAGRHRDQLAALLDLPPDASDQDIAETAAARAAQRALERSAASTAALVTPASQQPGSVLLTRLLDVLRWTHETEDAATVADRVVSEVWRLRTAEVQLAARVINALGWSVTDHPAANVDRALAQVERIAVSEAPKAQQLADALGHEIPAGGWPELLDVVRALAEETGLRVPRSPR